MLDHVALCSDLCAACVCEMCLSGGSAVQQARGQIPSGGPNIGPSKRRPWRCLVALSCWRALTE